MKHLRQFTGLGALARKPLALIVSMLIGLVGLSVPSTGAMAAIVPVVTSFPLQPVTASPLNTVVGPDGALWFTTRYVNQIGRITTSGAVTAYTVPTVGADPYDITVGPDGALWFTEVDTHKIGRIDTFGSITEFSLPNYGAYQAEPKDIVAGPDGALWFTGAPRYNTVGKITTSGDVTYFPDDIDEGSSAGIAAGSDGAVWFTEPGSNIVGRITTTGSVTKYSAASLPSGTHVSSITSGPDGALWFTGDTNAVGRITTGGVLSQLTYLPGVSNVGANELAFGPDGAIWFVESGASRIARMTTAGSYSDYTVYIPNTPSGAGLAGITAGLDNAMWFSSYYGSAIARISVPLNDTTAPTVTGAPVGTALSGWYDHDVTINWTATDPDSTATTPPPTAATLEGTNVYISAPSCDPSGNCASGSVTLSIDKTAPTVSPYGPLTKDVLTPLTLTAPASDNPSSPGTAVSGVVGGEYYVGTTDPGVGNGVPMTYSGGTLSAQTGDNTLTDLPAGTYQLNVRAKDAAGNWSTPTTARLTVVLPAPTNLYAVTPTNNAPVLTWNSVPTATSYQVWRQDTLTGTNIEVASSVTTTNFTDVYSPGVYNYSVVAVNSAGVTSVPSSAFQVAVTNTTTANARNIKAQGQSQVLPAFGADILPGLASGNTVQSSFDFDIGYPGGAFTITRPLTLTFNAGGHHLFLTSTSADWLVINGVNNSQGTFQGLASANLDNVTTTGLPYTVTAVDGALNPAGTSSLKLTVYTDSSRSTVLYSVNDTLTKGKIKIN